MFDLFRRFSGKEIQGSAEAQAKEFTDRVREAAKRGDKKALNDLMGNALIPKDAVSLNGHFYDEVKLALINLEKTRELDPFLEKFKELNEMMYDFYRDARMSVWIFHQVCREIGIRESFEEDCVGTALAQMRDPKRKSWIGLGHKQFVIEFVEAKYGPMSCTKERFWKSMEKDAVTNLQGISRRIISRSVNLIC